ncbi:hypothetical protein RJ639_014689 [Escallonia herrerae]|uniref:Uncharacterized protein n=1 Tax=Escallonia herrerae TaxID=1293975 RepID=A0AA88VL96_9ASTE|nr:hypothetical protein RJ639_014689 [Escallonia herrerae]
MAEISQLEKDQLCGCKIERSLAWSFDNSSPPDFHFRFMNHIARTTLFFCHFYWNSKDKVFYAFKMKECAYESKKLDFLLCYWFVEADEKNYDQNLGYQPSLVVIVASTAAAKHALYARSTPSLRAEASIPTKWPWQEACVGLVVPVDVSWASGSGQLVKRADEGGARGWGQTWLVVVDGLRVGISGYGGRRARLEGWAVTMMEVCLGAVMMEMLSSGSDGVKNGQPSLMMESVGDGSARDGFGG